MLQCAEVDSHSNQRSSTISNFFDRQTDFIQHRHEQIRHRCIVWIFDVTSTLHIPCGTSNNCHRKSHMVMEVWIAETATNEEKRVVEQVAVTLGNRLESVEQ